MNQKILGGRINEICGKTSRNRSGRDMTREAFRLVIGYSFADLL